METPSPASKQDHLKRTAMLGISAIAFLLALWSLIHSHALKHSLSQQSHLLSQVVQQQLPALTSMVHRHEQQLTALSQSPASDEARVHADVAQLIAQSQLTWEVTGSAVQTSRFLTLALGKLAPYQDSESNRLRTLLQADIDTLSKLNSTSPEQLITRLERLIQAINQVPLTPSTYQPSQLNTATTDPNHAWLARLHSLITVTKITPQLHDASSLHARETLRQNLLVKLSLCQWSVAQHQPTLYLQNLQAAHQYWQQLGINAANSAAIEQQFLDLLAMPLQPSLSLQSWQTSSTTSEKHP